MEGREGDYGVCDRDDIPQKTGVCSVLGQGQETCYLKTHLSNNPRNCLTWNLESVGITSRIDSGRNASFSGFSMRSLVSSGKLAVSVAIVADLMVRWFGK